MEQMLLPLAPMVLPGRVVLERLYFPQEEMAWRGTVHYGLL